MADLLCSLLVDQSPAFVWVSRAKPTNKKLTSELMSFWKCWACKLLNKKQEKHKSTF